MQGYVSTIGYFLQTDAQTIIDNLCRMYPSAGTSQITSWETLINDLKSDATISTFPEKTIVAIEYSLPTEGMAIDLLFAGQNSSGANVAFIIESKQWNDSYIQNASFSAYREDGMELHPQIQVSRHKLSFGSYLDIGSTFEIYPFVFIRNCSYRALSNMVQANPQDGVVKQIPVSNRFDEIIEQVGSTIVSNESITPETLINAEFCPSKDIVEAMKSIVTKEEPFILTEEQKETVSKVKTAISDGKKIIRIIGPAGSGKTAVLLNLYVEYLNEENSTTRPIFISGAQNTAYYRSVYPEVQGSFNYSFSLDRMVAKTKGNLYVIMMDEAQHNQQGIITNMVNRGATLILCYDPTQIISADNSIAELKELEKRDNFITIDLKDSVRFNGSQIAETNIRNYLNGQDSIISDDNYDFRAFNSFDDFQSAVIKLMQDSPNSTVAVTGLLSFDSDLFTYEKMPGSKLFTKWGNKTECEWMPYISDKNYLLKNNGKIWVGTWWMPGLDVDYIAVIVGGDIKRTHSGVVAVPEQAKHYRMMVSIAQQMGLPESLILEKKVFGKIGIDYFRSSKKIIEYLNEPGNETIKESYINLFSELLRNNYYIMMTRGRKGCYVYFTKNDDNEEE